MQAVIAPQNVYCYNIEMHDNKTHKPVLERMYMQKKKKKRGTSKNMSLLIIVFIQYIRVTGLSWDKRLSELPADPSRLLQWKEDNFSMIRAHYETTAGWSVRISENMELNSHTMEIFALLLSDFKRPNKS